MKVSVIVPLYNKAPYLRRALDSIAAQTFADFEVIVIDDGSTDEGPAIARDYGDRRVRLIEQPNAGPGAARNAGIAQARGELIAFLDADDEWEPAFLEQSVSLLEQFGSDVATITSGYVEYPAGASTEQLWRQRGIAEGVHRLRADMSPAQVVSMLAYMSPCTTVVRTEVIKRWGGFYDKDNCSYGEDAQLWLKVLLNERVAFSLQPLARFHREASGLSSNLSGVRPLEPFLNDATDIEGACRPELRDLLKSVLAIRAAKTACVLGYWGDWREARALVQEFTGLNNWRLPYHMPAAVCTTPIAPALGMSWRAAQRVLGNGTHKLSSNGHKSNGNTISRQTNCELRVLVIVEATTVNAIARNVLDFHRAARELRDHGVKDVPAVGLSLVTFDRGGSSVEFVEAAGRAGLHVDIIPENGRFDRGVVTALRTIIEERRPDIIVTHQVKSHFLMRLLRISRKIPWVAFNHGYTTTDRKMEIYNRFDRWSLPKADRVVTVCEAFAATLAANGITRDRVSVLHNSIRPQPRAGHTEADNVRQQLGISSNDRVILAVGRLSKEKAQADIIQALAFLRRSNPALQTKLVLVGDGPERSNLEAAAEIEGVADRVVFAGHVTDVQPYYAIADAVANSSHSEGSPYVLLEAMAAGVPIVATAVGGVPEMLTDSETALLVPPSEPAIMAQTIERLLNDKELARRLSSNAAAHVADKFSPEAYVHALVEIYRDVLSARAPRQDYDRVRRGR